MSIRAADSSRYIGLMSGTSLDGIDAVLIDLATAPRLIAAETYPFPPELRDQLLALCAPDSNEIERMGEADRQLGLALGDAVNSLLSQAAIQPASIRAIGSHGQTIRHRPPSDRQAYPFTLQIGDPSSIAQVTGITTVADFRRRDIAAGGQGAPLVPAFHRAVFHSSRARAIVNIGGIANITGLSSGGESISGESVGGDIFGFDTGPGNTLLDSWIARHQGAHYDRDGNWAASGVADTSLLASLLSDPFFAAPPPKSSGREHFNLAWLDRHLADSDIETADVQSTLVELTAISIAQAIASLPFVVDEVFVCGGGAYNRHLMSRLAALLHPRRLGDTTELGIAPEWVEAAAFAWLAQQTLAGKPSNEPAVTGANRHCILGAIYPA